MPLFKLKYSWNNRLKSNSSFRFQRRMPVLQPDLIALPYNICTLAHQYTKVTCTVQCSDRINIFILIPPSTQTAHGMDQLKYQFSLKFDILLSNILFDSSWNRCTNQIFQFHISLCSDVLETHYASDYRSVLQDVKNGLLYSAKSSRRHLTYQPVAWKALTRRKCWFRRHRLHILCFSCEGSPWSSASAHRLSCWYSRTRLGRC